LSVGNRSICLHIRQSGYPAVNLIVCLSIWCLVCLSVHLQSFCYLQAVLLSVHLQNCLQAVCQSVHLQNCLQAIRQSVSSLCSLDLCIQLRLLI